MDFGNFFEVILYQPLLNLLILLYQIFWDQFWIAILMITVIIKVVSYPLTKPSIEMARKQKEIAPKLKELKEKYKNPEIYAKKQMELMKEHGINPVAGCLPMLLQIVPFYFLYRIFTELLQSNGVISEHILSSIYNWEYLKFAPNETLNANFLFYNLATIDSTYTLPFFSAVAQFFMSKYMMKMNRPTGEIAKTTPDAKDDFMYNMQESMTYTFPIITFFIGIALPAGMSFYWLISTIISLLQYMILNKGNNQNGIVTNTKQNK